VGCGGPCGDPATPLFTAPAGTPVRFRVPDVAGHPRQHGFTVFGHHWNFEPWTNNSTAQGVNLFTFEAGSYSGIGPTRHDNILTNASGLFSIAGDYLYRTQESFQFSSGGLWGIFRVTPAQQMDRYCLSCQKKPVDPQQ
jgi:manganese oxidase